MDNHLHNFKEGAFIDNSNESRICMFTARNFTRKAFQCGFYEAQDVLSEVDNVDLFYLQPRKAYQIRESMYRRIVWHDFSRRLVLINQGLKPIFLNKEYELFIAVCGTLKDLLQINAVRGWKDHCRKSVLWIDELLTATLPSCRSWLPAFQRFDHIIVGFSGTVKALSNAVGRPCHYVPGAVDAIRFTPYPEPPSRVIDIYSIGRRWDGMHNALRDRAAKRKLFYLFDTFEGSVAQTLDYRQHREVFANIAKRSSYFVVAPAKMNLPEEMQGQAELGYRYYEGSAAGAVMIGQIPDCESFRSLFGWPDSVIETSPDGSNVEEVLSSLESNPDRVLEVGRRNAAEALLRHDWVYRWKQILAIAGLTPTRALIERERRLKKLADAAINHK